MASMIEILISIASIAAISKEAVTIDNSNTDWNYDHIDQLSETPSQRNLQNLMFSNDLWPLFLNIPNPKKTTSSLTETTKTEVNASQHDAGQRNRQQIDGQIIGEAGGSSSVKSTASSSSPSKYVNGEVVYPMSVKNWILQQQRIKEMNRNRKPMLGNRRRRFASGAEISANNNTTASADPTPISIVENSDGYTMKALKCLMSLSLPISLPTQCIQFYFFGYN